LARGADTVRATDAGTGLSGTAAVTVVNLPPTVASNAYAYASPVTGTSTFLSVVGADTQYDDSSLTYTWAVTSAPAGAPAPTFSTNGSYDAQNTTATFYRAGTYTLQATIAVPSGLTATSSVRLTVDQTPTSISVSPGGATLAVHSRQQFQAVALDQFGQKMARQPRFTWSIASGGIGTINNGQYNSPNSGAGSATIQADADGLTGTATVTVEELPPVITHSASANPNPVTGTQTQLQVQASDPQGAKLSYAWTVKSEPAGAPAPTFNNPSNDVTNVTFHQAGSYTFTVTVTDALGLSTTSSVTVTVAQTLTGLSLTPATATLANGGTQQFSALALDQFGEAMAVPPAFTCSGGTISSTGLYTAPAKGKGTFQVEVSADGLNAQANVTVT
jgi:hypothetical protein